MRCAARLRPLVRVGFALSVAVLTAPPLARAAWDRYGIVQISSETQAQALTSSPDESGGVWIAWNDVARQLRVVHLLANGDFDPSWPAGGAVACTTRVARSSVAMIRTTGGAVVLLWSENTVARLQRLDATGRVDARWPLSGMRVDAGSANSGSGGMAQVIADDSDGAYVAWISNDGPTEGARGWLTRVKPSGGVAAGWPQRLSRMRYIQLCEYWPRLALADDGGVFVLWGSWSELPQFLTSAWKLRRFTATGRPATGWGFEGVDLGPELLSDPELSIQNFVEMRLNEVVSDREGGVVVVFDGPEPAPTGLLSIALHLRRVDGRGVVVEGWPEDSVVADGLSIRYDLSTRAPFYFSRDERDGYVFAKAAGRSIHSSYREYARISRTGALDGPHGMSAYGRDGWLVWSAPTGIHMVGWGFVGADFNPYAIASVLEVTGWSPARAYNDFEAYPPPPTFPIHSVLDLTPTVGGEAVLVWTQELDRFGLFARRLPPPLSTAAAEVPAVATRAHARFAPGVGVLVRGFTGRVEVFDVAGRRVESGDVVAGEAERPIAGASDLPAGLYFVRGRSAERAITARVLVTR